MKVWTIEEIKNWQESQPYRVGANFVPSSAINQLEMWQKESFDPETIDRELGFAEDVGMNAMRVYLHDLLWEQDSSGFCERIDRYLEIADRRGISTMFVIFDDCWNQSFALGTQPEPKPFTHNSGWVQSPGVRIVNDSSKWERLERYVKGLLYRYRNDERIFAWDLYNEPGNGTSGDDSLKDEKQIDRSLPLLKSAFEWARSVGGVTQPLTSAIWNFDESFARINEFLATHSDFISFHCYASPHVMVEKIEKLRVHDRPLFCSEYMARGQGSSFAYTLPMLKRFGIGAFNWGLVSGRTQTIYPWGWTEEKGEPCLLFHDVFSRDGGFLYPLEEAVIREVTGVQKYVV
ncbi:hypothetical protein [Pelagicoccus mobilis]|uniref:1,4-beta-xylanase n=1 Tax=Pelagicoccus mobilis TaxID=415221 RepID=A0A934VMX8_9BACT|nr:hypothetical protein [Pelagicoccus mobilis]MBK1879321.1 hypothetical protein [Pelagicoccus mobilis]